jgi:hypothetical protein
MAHNMKKCRSESIPWCEHDFKILTTTTSSTMSESLSSNELKFACGNCGQHISAATDQAGMSAPCPNCGNSVTVPGRTATSLESTSAGPLTKSLSAGMNLRYLFRWGIAASALAAGLSLIAALASWNMVSDFMDSIPQKRQYAPEEMVFLKAKTVQFKQKRARMLVRLPALMTTAVVCSLIAFVLSLVRSRTTSWRTAANFWSAVTFLLFALFLVIRIFLVSDLMPTPA